MFVVLKALTGPNKRTYNIGKTIKRSLEKFSMQPIFKIVQVKRLGDILRFKNFDTEQLFVTYNQSITVNQATC